MGGKSRKGERVKDNARPSSSSHCAQLLGNNIPIFFDFSTAKDSFFGSSEDLSCGIDANFQIALKKMTKKDSITKLKALQEFTELCKNSDTDTVKLILPFWPRLYCTLASDTEHRVREAVHCAHAALIDKVKKSIAPYLKQLAGLWFTSQFDNYPPAATAATAAFEQAFPPSKHNKFILFCQDEILDYIYDTLIEHSPCALINEKFKKTEDSDGKYQRIVIASLKGYDLYLQKLSSEQIKESEERNKKIVSSPKFWEYSKNKISTIRYIFFCVLISLCKNAQFLLCTQMKHVGISVLNQLDDSDPLVMSSAWDALLNILVFLEDCFTYLSIEKQVFNKLNSVIRKGGRNAVTILPSVLPLLSKIRSGSLEDKADFYSTVFRNISLLMDESYINKPTMSDGKKIAVTLAECLKYVLIQHKQDVTFCNTMIINHFIPVLEKMLTSQKSKNTPVKSCFFVETSKLIRSWYSNSPSSVDNFDNIKDSFWKCLVEVFQKSIELAHSSEMLKDVLNNHIELIKSLQNPNLNLHKANRVITFKDELSNSDADVGNENQEMEEYNPEFQKYVLEFTKKNIALYLKNCIEHERSAYISALSQIAKLYNSKVILEEFVKVQNESSLYSLFCNLFCKWLETPSLRSGEIVELSFSLIQYVEKEEKESILQAFFKDWPNNELEYEICRCLLKYSCDSSVKRWISSELFSNYLTQLTKNYVDGENDNEITENLITTFFNARDINNEYIIGVPMASSIMNILSKSLRLESIKTHVRKLGQNIIVNIGDYEKQNIFRDSFEELVIALFKVSCYNNKNDDLNESCGVALRSILGCERPDFIKKLAEVIIEVVLKDNVAFCWDNIMHRINYIIELYTGCTISSHFSSNSEVGKFVSVIKDFIQEPYLITKWRQRLERCCFTGYQSIGDWDLWLVELKNEPNQLKIETNEDTSQRDLENLLQKVIHDFEGAKLDLKSGNINYYELENVWKYYQLFIHARRLNKFINLNFPDETVSESDDENLVEIIKKFCKWNVYVGKILNLLAYSHARSYKIQMLQEPWNSYYIDDNELSTISNNLTCDILPIKISAEQMDCFRGELKTLEDYYSGSEYEEKGLLIPLCGEILNFIFSVGLIVSFTDYYAGTKFFPVLENVANKLKGLGKEIFMNFTLMDNLFFYYSCKHFMVKSATWRMIKPILQELFLRRFTDTLPSLEPMDLRDFINTEISKSYVQDNTLLKLRCILKSESVYIINEDEWSKIFVYINKYFESFKFDGNILESDLTTLSVLSRTVLQMITLFKENNLNSSDQKLCPEACLAWNEIVRVELWKHFFTMWQKLANVWFNKTMSPEMLITVQNISEVVRSGTEFMQNLTLDCIKLAKKCIEYITSSCTSFQVTSFELLLRLVPELVKVDSETFCNNLSKINEDMKDESFQTSECDWTCKHLENVISCNQGIVETLISDFVSGDCCSVEPFTDSFNYTYSYLLIWCFLLEMCGEAHSSLRLQYGFWLRDKGYTTSLLKSVFKLMPEAVIHGSEAKDHCQRYFENRAYVGLKEPVKSERIEALACFVYRMFLQRLPNIIREWWSQSENKTSTLVDKVTSQYVSPILISNELKNVQQDRDSSFDNMEIKTHPNAREVVATYIIDEVKMDLVMTLPQNFPLGTIKIESSNMVVSTSSRRNWLFHISKYLIHQNGSIWEALIMWKNNLDKKFEGVEECYICASILQGSSFETPRVSCHICKKKFHSHCLYKWFSTSNNSSCPICRNLF